MIGEAKRQKVTLTSRKIEEAKTADTDSDRTVLNRSFIHPSKSFSYDSILDSFSWIWPGSRIKTATYLEPQNSLVSRQQKSIQYWHEQLQQSPTLNRSIPTQLLRQPIPGRIRRDIFGILMPNHQQITEKTYQINKKRARRVLQGRVQPFYNEVTLFKIGQDIGSLVTNQFLQQNLSLLQEVQAILAALCVFRIDIGQKKQITRITLLLHSYLNRHLIHIFALLCHIVSSNPYRSFLTGAEDQIQLFLTKLQRQLEQSNTSISVLFTRRHPKLLREALTNWILSLFSTLFFDDTIPHLDPIYSLQQLQQREDFIVDRILNYLLARRMQQGAWIDVCIAILTALERHLVRNQPVERLKTVLSRPKYFMDFMIFDNCLF